MRRSLPLTFVASALVAASCPGETSKKDCARACEVASQCGVLPSILGGSAGDDLRDILNDCEFRCENSDEDSDDDDADDEDLDDDDADDEDDEDSDDD